MEDKDTLILSSQYHGCWWPGDASRQDINNHDIDLFLQEYSSTKRINSKYNENL